MIILYLVVSLQIIGVSRGDIYIFNSEKDYLIKNTSSRIFLEKTFYNAYDAEFDFLWLYILDESGLYTINPLTGRIISFYPFKKNFYRFTRDKNGNFYLLERTKNKIKVINFTQKDSFYLEFSPTSTVKKMHFKGKCIYFLYPDELISLSLENKEIKRILKGNYNSFKIFDSLKILWREDCILIKNKTEKELCLNLQIFDLTLFKDTLLIIDADSIYRIPFKEIYK